MKAPVARDSSTATAQTGQRNPPVLSEVTGLIRRHLRSPAAITAAAPHVRDSINLRWLSTLVLLSLMPSVLIGAWNIGYQANSFLNAYLLEEIPGWRGVLLEALGAGFSNERLWDNLAHGLVYMVPVFAVVLLAGSAWELLFAVVRRRPLSEGIGVLSLLFTLTLPPTIPLWQAAVGISFGVVIGKEIFGGTGRNFVNPVLAGRAFLYFAYPDQIAGDSVWTAIDGFSGATPLGLLSMGGIDNITASGITWTGAFLGHIPGTMGGTSTLACLLGGILLVYTGIISWRIIAGGLAGVFLAAMLFNLFGTGDNALFGTPWYWHMVLGGFAFGIVFLATDPVTSAQTRSGRWLYGLFIGLLIVVIRIANPTIPECTMFAILLGNIFAPLIDYLVIQADIHRRRRYAGRPA